MPTAKLSNPIYGVIEYEDLPRGYIKITNRFPQDHCVLSVFPLIGKKFVHREMVQPLYEALKQIESMLEVDADCSYIEEFQVYCPRHQWNLKNKPLSMHAWALAFDINPSDNAPGTKGNVPLIVVDSFKACGFIWGGDWSNLDPMHFELRLKK